MKTKSHSLFLSIFFILIFFTFFAFSIPYFSGDVKNHVVWGRSILYEGPQGFYGRQFHDYSFPNYPPVSMLSFALSVGFYDFSKTAILQLNKYPIFPSGLVGFINYENTEIAFLKIPAVLPFVLTGLVIYYFAKFLKKDFKESFFYVLIFLFNPAFFYLAVVWGQNDFSQVLFILLSILFLLYGSFLPSSIFAGLSILSKQTALMIWGIMIVSYFKLFGLKKFFVGILVSLILIWFSYLIFNNQNIFWPFTFYNETLRTTGLLVSDNAINFWGAITGFNQTDSQQAFLGLKFEHWGFLIFTLLFIPAFLKFYFSKFNVKTFIYFLFLSSILYFFVLTRMHERYLVFGVVFAQLLMMIDKKYWFNLAFFTILFFVNLYKGLLLPDIPFVTSMLNISFYNILAVGYLLLLVYNYYIYMKLKDEKN